MFQVNSELYKSCCVKKINYISVPHTIFQHMATNQRDVYACGDIVEFPLFTTGMKNANVQHWQMAHAHG